MGIKCDLDKFYTKVEVVKTLLPEIDFSPYDLVIEPSAGAGAFSSNIPHAHVLAMDLEPSAPNIIQQNWFDYKLPENYKNVLVIGNPPFGQRNKLSKSFIEKALSFENVKTIALVLPNVYNKHTNQKIFPKHWKLEKIINLPEDSFLFEGQSYHVPCSFFVWTVFDVQNDLRFDIEKYQHSADFEITLEKEKADFFIMGASPRVVKAIEDVHVNNRGYYLISKIDKKVLKNRFENINWSAFGNSSAQGGVSWYTKVELIKVYEEQKHAITDIKN